MTARNAAPTRASRLAPAAPGTAPLAEPWAAVSSKYQVGQVVRGPTTKLATFEAFAEIEPGVEELIHISELPDERITHRSRSCAKARASCCESSRSTRPATISASARGRWTTRRT